MWVLGGQCGLTPEQVLDMNVPMFQAYVNGYQEHLFDMQCLAVHQGYWAGYYQSKKPKSAPYILERMIRDHEKEKKRKRNKELNVPKPEVDMEKFMKLEEKRMEYLASRAKKE